MMKTEFELRKSGRCWEAVLVAPEGKPPTLDFESMGQLQELVANVESALESGDEDAPSCLVIGSSSERCFCAGANIAILDTLSGETMSDWITMGHAVLNSLEDLPIPVIAKVRGYALGGGLELALACDLIVCDETAQLGLTEANMGFVPGWGGTYRLPGRIGAARAKRLFYAAKIVDSAEALSMGLVDEVLESEKMDCWLDAFSREVELKSSVGIRGFKSILNAGERAARQASLDAEVAQSLLCIEDADTKKRIREFLDKRKK